jgi:DNA-binding transcriptional LysR family regulator
VPAALPAAQPERARLHPEAQIEVLVASGAAMREAFLEGRIQLLVGDPAYMAPLQPLWRRRSPLVWAAAADWSAPAGPLPLVLFSRPCNWRQPLLDALTAAGAPWRVAFESSSLAAVQAAVRSGIGVAALFGENLLAGMAVWSAPGLPAAPDAEIALFRREDARGEPLVDALGALLRRHLAPRG